MHSPTHIPRLQTRITPLAWALAFLLWAALYGVYRLVMWALS